MSYINKWNRPQLYGDDCIFAITDFSDLTLEKDLNHAVVTGTINEIDTPWGTGIRAGTSSNIAFTPPTNMHVSPGDGEAFSWLCLFKCYDISLAGTLMYRLDATDDGLWMWINNNGRFLFDVDQHSFYSPINTVREGEWILYAATAVPGDKVYVYINNAAGVVYAATSNAAAAAESVSVTAPFQVSGYGSDIAMVALFNSALSQSYLQRLWDQLSGRLLYV